MPATEDSVKVTLTVPFRMHRGITELAKQAGIKPTLYVSHLLNAAYTARVKPPSGDADLDAAVGMVAVLWAEHRDTDTIAAVLGLSPKTVGAIVTAWQQHHLAQAEGGARG